MEQYELLEKAVLNCFIVKPELLKTTKLIDKHFIKHKRFFNFIKKFYKTFGNLDITLIGSVCTNPKEVIDYLADIIDVTSISSNYELYEQRLLLFYEDYEKIEEIHKLERRLYTREIDLDEFKSEIKRILR